MTEKITLLNKTKTQYNGAAQLRCAYLRDLMKHRRKLAKIVAEE